MASPFLSEFDLHLLGEGTHYRTFEKLGAHICKGEDGTPGVHFAVWAPNALDVCVIGTFNRWEKGAHPMRMAERSGIWECFIPNVGEGAVYKYHIRSRLQGFDVDKSDPHAFASEIRPLTASKVWDIDKYEWQDKGWMESRAARQSLDAPISIYELHLGSWRRNMGEDGRWYTYREIAPILANYLREMGFTHVEFLPLTEHPFDGSWGYQTVGYFSPTSRFGTPDDLMFLIDTLHQAGIGVIMDWVPAHFPRDGHGLGFFDGTHLYEHADPRQGLHVDWGTFIFNYGRPQVKNFLISSALFWLEKYHIDGLRVDAVASMLYLDYSRKHGEWVPNRFGGRENLEAIDFLRTFNERVYAEHPDVMTMAEESTAWPMVSKPTYLGGLGFGEKWNMGWMHDVLHYISKDPIYRPFHHHSMTFSMLYCFTENFLLPFSHDEVVHGKGSMIAKMPGDEWQKFANLRLLYGFMFGHPGKKLLFMGAELGQWQEWNHDAQLEWRSLGYYLHAGIQAWMRDLNRAYAREAAFHQVDFSPAGFEWVDCDDTLASVFSFLRFAANPDDALLFVCNFTPVVRHNYRVGIPWGGWWEEILNSDASEYGGSGMGNFGGLEGTPIGYHGRPNSLNLTLPPLACVVFRGKRPG